MSVTLATAQRNQAATCAKKLSPTAEWLIMLAPGTYFALTNLAQNIAIEPSIAAGFGLPLWGLAFFVVYNLLAAAIIAGRRLPPLFPSGGIGVARAVIHAGFVGIAAPLHLLALAFLTAAVRAPTGLTEQTAVYYEEILITCFPIWVFAYGAAQAALFVASAYKAQKPADAAPARFAVRDAGATKFIDPRTVRRVEAEGNYVRIITDFGACAPRTSIEALERLLPDTEFIRVHRGALVRREDIIAVQRQPTGAYSARLRDGATAPVSRRRLAAVRAALRA